MFLTTLEYLPELLRDEITLQALLSEAGVSDAAAGIRGGNFVSRCIDRGGAAAALAEAAQHRSGQGPLRVLEAGASIGRASMDAIGGRPPLSVTGPPVPHHSSAPAPHSGPPPAGPSRPGCPASTATT